MSSHNYLYQKISEDSKYTQVVSKFAKFANETSSFWASRIENKILHLNKLEKEEKKTLVKDIAIDYNVRRPCSKFSGISNTSAKKSKLLDIGKEISYELALKLHELWLEYVKEILGPCKNHQQACKALAMCDLQGANVTVHESNCSSYTNTSGVIVRETKHGFNIVTRDNQVKFILKENTTFRLIYNEWTFFLYGHHLIHTPAQRSKRKLKIKHQL